jgi:hypothetical protein
MPNFQVLQLVNHRLVRRNMIDHAPTLKFRGLVNRLSGVHHFTKARRAGTRNWEGRAADRPTWGEGESGGGKLEFNWLVLFAEIMR